MRYNRYWTILFVQTVLHIVINEKGEVLNFAVTQANVDDREQPLKNEYFLQQIFGKLFADKGYVSDKLKQLLFVDGIISNRKYLITQL